MMLTLTTKQSSVLRSIPCPFLTSIMQGYLLSILACTPHISFHQLSMFIYLLFYVLQM